MLIPKTLHHAARFALYLWLLVSLARVLKHTHLTLTEPPLYSPPINLGSDYQFFIHRFRTPLP